MADQIYYKIQYPLKRAVDLMRDLEENKLDSISKNLTEYDKEKIENFIDQWNKNSKEKIKKLIKNLRAGQ